MLFVLAFVSLASSLHAQQPGGDPPPAVDAKVGWNQAVKGAHQIPVTVWVDYQGSDEIDGTVSVTGIPLRYVPSGPVKDVFTTDISLSPPSMKRVDFTIPYRSNIQELVITFESPGLPDTIVIRRPPRIQLDEDGILIVVVGREGTVLSALQRSCERLSESRVRSVKRRTIVRSTEQAAVVRIDSQELSDRWADYDAVDLLVLREFGSAQMPPRVAEAIAKWVLTGGSLLVTGGVDPRILKDTVLWPLLPVIPRGISVVESFPGLPDLPSPSAEERSGFLVRDYEWREEAAVRTWPIFPDGPLVVERRVGGGWIGFVPLDIGLPPLARDEVGEGFWDRLIPRIASEEDPLIALSFAEPETTYRGMRGSPDSPEVPLVVLGVYLGSYFLFIGPINYIFVRRRKRFDLVWVTVPCISIFFFVVAYIGGFVLWGSRMTLREVTLAEVFPNPGTGGTTSMVRYVSRMRVNSPSKSRHDIQIADEVLPVADALPNNPDWVQLRDFEIVQGPGTQLDDLPFNMWSSRFIYVENVVEVTGGIRGSAVLDGDQLKASVVCDLSTRLEKAGMYFRGIREIDSMNSGKDGVYSFAFPASAQGREIRYDVFHSGSYRSRQDPVEVAFLQAIYYLETAFGIASRSEPYFIAIARTPTHSIKADGRSIDGERYTAYIARIPITAVGEEAEIPADLWREVAHDEKGIVNPSGESCYVQPGTVSWDFYGPPTVDLLIPTRMEILFPSEAPTVLSQLEIFDPLNSTWRDLFSVGEKEEGKVIIRFDDRNRSLERFIDRTHRKVSIRAVIAASASLRRQEPWRGNYWLGMETAQRHGLIAIRLYGGGTGL